MLAHSSIGIGIVIPKLVTKIVNECLGYSLCFIFRYSLNRSCFLGFGRGSINPLTSTFTFSCMGIGLGILGEFKFGYGCFCWYYSYTETKNNPVDSKISFGSYVVFGILFSLFMLGYYIMILSLLYLKIKGGDYK